MSWFEKVVITVLLSTAIVLCLVILSPKPASLSLEATIAKVKAEHPELEAQIRAQLPTREEADRQMRESNARTAAAIERARVARQRLDVALERCRAVNTEQRCQAIVKEAQQR